MAVTEYEVLESEIIELYIAFWEYREMLSWNEGRVNALASIAVYAEVIDNREKVGRAIAEMEAMGYDSKKCIEIKKRDLKKREEETQKNIVAFEYGDFFAVDMHEAVFKLDLLFKDCEQNYPYPSCNMKIEEDHIAFNDIEYDGDFGSQQWLKLPFSNECPYWEAKKDQSHPCL